MRSIMYILVYCWISVALATVEPTPSPANIVPSHGPTLFPTQILQTRMNIFVNIRSTPQISVSTFKRNYRSSIEAAMVEILTFPNEVVQLGQVLVTEIEPIASQQFRFSRLFDTEYSRSGNICSLPSTLQTSVSVKISFILENTGFETEARAFDEITDQLATATENGHLQQLTNTYIPTLNPGKQLALLNISCFSSSADATTSAIMRSPSPSFAPTYRPDSDGDKKYAVALCMSVIIFVFLFAMATGSVVDHRDRSSNELMKVHSEETAGPLLIDTLTGRDAMSKLSMASVGPVFPANIRRKRLLEAITIVKSAIPYMEYVQRLDVLRAFVAYNGQGSIEEVDFTSSTEIEGTELSWSYYWRYLIGAHDGKYAQNIWTQHRWFSCLFFVPNKGRALRCFSLFYKVVLVLCFDVLLVVHTDILHPAREVHTLFAREVVILCCITALVSSACFGFVETVVFYSFDDAKERLAPLVVDMVGPKSGNESHQLDASSNWQSVSVDSIGEPGEATALDTRSPQGYTSRRGGRPPAITITEKVMTRQDSNDRKARGISAQLSPRFGLQRRYGSPESQSRAPAFSHPRVVGGRNKPSEKQSRVAPALNTLKAKRLTDFSEHFRSALVGEEYLYSESMVSELIRLQDDILFCREAIHSACNQFRVPSPAQYGQNENEIDYELAVEDALLAVQFDAVWGLGSDGTILAEGCVVSDWRDRHTGDGNQITAWWRKYISKLFTAYKGETSSPSEGAGLNNPLMRVTSDIVRVRRQVLKEQLKIYADVVGVEAVRGLQKSVNNNSSAGFDFLNADPGHFFTLNRIRYVSPGDDRQKMRRRLVQLFHDDALSPLSAAIVRNQIHRNRWLTEKLYAEQRLRSIGAFLLVVSLLAMISWIYYYSSHILNKRQSSILIVFLFWTCLDSLCIETVSVLLRHVVVPSFAHHDVSEVISWLIFNIMAADKVEGAKENTAEADGNTDSQLYTSVLNSDSNLKVRPTIHGEIIPNIQGDKDDFRSLRHFNAAKHLFVSVRLASACFMKYNFLEASSIANFQTLWPKKAYISTFGARNIFGYFNENGVCLFSEDGEEYTQNRPSAARRRQGSVAPARPTTGTPSIALQAPSVAQWVPQSAREDKHTKRTRQERYFSFHSIARTAKTCAYMCFFWFIEVLPIILQDILIEYAIWAIVLWLLYLCVYIVNTNVIVIVVPAMVVLLFLRTLMSMLSNKNRLGLAEDEFEVEPEIEAYRDDEFEDEEEELFDGNLDHEDRSNRSRDQSCDRPYSEDNPSPAEEDVDYESRDEYAETQRAFHDRDDHIRNHTQRVAEPGSEFGDDDDANYYGAYHTNHDFRKPFGNNPARTTGDIPTARGRKAQQLRPDKGGLSGRKTVSLPPLRDNQRFEYRTSLDQYSENEYENYNEEIDRYHDEQTYEYGNEDNDHGWYPPAQHIEAHHYPMHHPSSASATISQDGAEESVAAGGGGSILRSTTAHTFYMHRAAAEDINDGRLAPNKSPPSGRKGLSGHFGRPYDENDTPFTEVPAYAQSVYRNEKSDPFAAFAVTPAFGMGANKRAYDNDGKYNPIISPPNATPQAGGKETDQNEKSGKPKVTQPQKGELLTESVIKKGEAEMRQWALDELQQESPGRKISIQMFNDDADDDVVDNSEPGDTESERETKEVEDAPLARGRLIQQLQQLAVNEAEGDQIIYSMSRFGKSN